MISPFFIDQGDNVIHIQLYLREFELRIGRILLDLSGQIQPTGRTFNYWESINRETHLDDTNLPVLEGVPAKLQLFVMRDGQTYVNSELLKSLFLEGRIKGELENTGENSFKIVICESRKLSNDPTEKNRWTIYSQYDERGPHIMGEAS